MNRAGHTEADHAALIDARIDPESTQPREHQARCWCGKATWNQSGGCDRHYILPAAVRRKLAERVS